MPNNTDQTDIKQDTPLTDAAMRSFSTGFRGLQEYGNQISILVKLCRQLECSLAKQAQAPTGQSGEVDWMMSDATGESLEIKEALLLIATIVAPNAAARAALNKINWELSMRRAAALRAQGAGEPVCAGPFVDARDCPVHAKDVQGQQSPPTVPTEVMRDGFAVIRQEARTALGASCFKKWKDSMEDIVLVCDRMLAAVPPPTEAKTEGKS